MLRTAWQRHAEAWIAWARAPGHDSYWRFHRDAFLALVPPPGRLTVDVGCGEGRLARDLARRGHRLLALDAAPALAAAAAGHPDATGPVAVADAAALPIADRGADVVVAFMSLQDVDDLDRAVAEAARVLRPGGRLVIALVHPVNSAGAFEPDPAGGAARFVLTGSWFERRPVVDTSERGGYAMTFHSEHRPLQTYTEALAAAGFVIERLREVADPDPAVDWHRMPLFVHLLARRD